MNARMKLLPDIIAQRACRDKMRGYSEVTKEEFNTSSDRLYFKTCWGIGTSNGGILYLYFTKMKDKRLV